MRLKKQYISARNTKKIFNRISNKNNNYVLLPLGKTFHIAPSNVDTIFVYSWLISMLMGNINVIRISSRISEQIDCLIGLIDNTLGEKRFEN